MARIESGNVSCIGEYGTKIVSWQRRNDGADHFILIMIAIVGPLACVGVKISSFSAARSAFLIYRERTRQAVRRRRWREKGKV
jgi:hypothetical protein